jgi:hypothetical protein
MYVNKDISRAIYLEDQGRNFYRKKKRTLSELQEILNILQFFSGSYFLDQSDKILFILNSRQESFSFLLQTTLSELQEILNSL